MDRLIALQMRVKKKIEKTLANYKKDGISRKNSAEYFTRRLHNLEEDWKEFKKQDSELTIQASVEDIKELDYFVKDLYSEVEEIYLETYAAIEADYHAAFQLQKNSNVGQSFGSGSISESTPICDQPIKLPKISLEKFSGDYRIWPTFYDLFKTLVHENQRLANVQKLQYLKLHLTGEAENLLRHFSVTDNNYESAWELLKDRYNNKRVLVNAQLKSIFSQNVINVESAVGIKTLLDTTTECLQALQNLDISIDCWDVIIVYFVVQKLPTESRSLWEQSLSQTKDLPTWKDLQDFLKARFRTLEAISSDGHSKNPRFPPTKNRAVAQAFHSYTAQVSCPVCSSNHSIRQCKRFAALEFVKKFELVKTKGLCLNCLGSGHISSACPSTYRCARCNKPHHTLMHKNSTNNSLNSSNPSPNTTSPLANHSTSATISTPRTSNLQICDTDATAINTFFVNDSQWSCKSILLATALVKAVDPSGDEIVLRVLIDQGSQASFITESAVQLLGLTKQAVHAVVSGVGQLNAGAIHSQVKLKLKPLNDTKCCLKVTGLVMRKLTQWLPLNRIRPGEWKHLQGLQLADPYFNHPRKVDMLLGADIYSKIIQDGLIKGPENTPIAQNTIFGWILSGKINSNSQPADTIVNFHILADLDNTLRSFWEIEKIPHEKFLTEEERKCEEVFKSTCHRLNDGRYEVSLPLADPTNTKPFGESRQVAITRLHHIETRFKRDPSLQREYSKCIQEYVDLGHAEQICFLENRINESDTYSVCYLPHHAVVKADRTTTKVRVVFDGSKRTRNGKSLNEILLKGPTIQDDLVSLLIRWRKYRIGLSADIEKMYRQIRIKKEHADYQRIVWRDSPEKPIADYRLLTVTFGTKSAPFLAIRVLKQLALDEQHGYPIGAEMLLSEFYVDDLLSGADTKEEATEKQNQIVAMLKTAGFNLRKWSSNVDECLLDVSEDDRQTKIDLNLGEREQVKALGLYWDTTKDSLCYSPKFNEYQTSYTKRTILSDIARLFDPLGWIAPTTVIAKIFIQSLWLAKIDWDDRLPPELENRWKQFRENLFYLKELRIPRWFGQSNNVSIIEMHGFSDASLQAYAAAIYICISNEQGIKKSTLLMAKTKVSPVKTISLPRLELCGAVLLAKIMKYAFDTLRIHNIKMHAWTDSEIVISWLRGHPSKWTTFIANRVSQIHELIGDASWRHVASKENPADYATRGLSPRELKDCQHWWKGPLWLEKRISDWPLSKDIKETSLELRKSSVNCLQVTLERMEENYSSLTRLLRVTSYCKRFRSKEKNHIKSTELLSSLHLWLRKTQSEHFQEEIRALKLGTPIKKSSRLIKLTPFIDENGLLRLGGRLKYSNLSYDERFPIVIPDKCYLTQLIIRKAHLETLHGGCQLTMRIICKQFWLLNARNTIRQYIHNCVTCYKIKGETQQQLMGHLPRPRVTYSRPFSHTGTDYCGPFMIRKHKLRGSGTYKAYVAMFVCLAVKAIHIELVTDLSAPGFLAAFRRFAARRGLPSDVYCDSGSNFVGGNIILIRERQQMIEDIDNEIAKLIENEGVKFHFIPPAAPHFGGLWEAGVKSTKFHMKRIIGNSILTYEELSTCLTQIEACLNSRPLCAASTDPKDLTPLTPAHFLIGDILLTPAEPTVLKINENRLDRWQYVQRLYQSFWKRWYSEYLSCLQQRPKWTQIKSNLKVGDLVLLKEDNIPPMRWCLARIMELHPGSDGLVRVVTIKTKTTILKRPITKICRLPIENHDMEINNI